MQREREERRPSMGNMKMKEDITINSIDIERKQVNTVTIFANL